MISSWLHQVSMLRNEIEEKQSIMADLKDELQKLSLAFEQLQKDHEKLKKEDSEKTKKLNVRRNYHSRRLISIFLDDCPCDQTVDLSLKDRAFLYAHLVLPEPIKGILDPNFMSLCLQKFSISFLISILSAGRF